MSNNELLSVEPLNLRFPYIWNKKISTSFNLTNKTDNNVAFKVKTTNPRNYSVKPNCGVILPRSTCEVHVTMQELRLNEKLMIVSVIASPGVTANEITQEMFSEEAGRVVEYHKMRITFYDVKSSSCCICL